MKVTLWGTRGSLASPGPETARYGGNTACVEVRSGGSSSGSDEALVVLDAGTGLRRLGDSLPRSLPRVDLLLTHLHLDHILGLGFFAPLYDENTEVHLWGPASTTLDLKARLSRYLSPPLFPVHLRDLPRPSRVSFHDTPRGEFTLGPFRVRASFVCHPGPTLGYRIATEAATLAYLPDHEPALGAPHFPLSGDWTSGFSLARDADLLIHDAQYTPEEYASHVGWGHSSWRQAFAFAALAGVKRLVPFHHDPGHSDEYLDGVFSEAVARENPPFRVMPVTEGAVFDLLNWPLNF
jgi:phosphoribosyl 1,2-cyclic phosphodiesterase